MQSTKLSNRQSALAIDSRRLKRACREILRDAGIENWELSIAVVDDPTIHELNRQYLAHDYPTDVLSFLLEHEGNCLEGQIVASADTAIGLARNYGWPAGDELLLYVIHAALHLVGYDDKTAKARRAMREREVHYLSLFGLKRPDKPLASRRRKAKN